MIKKRLLILCLAVVLVLGIIATSVAENVYKIGAILPFTGALSEFGFDEKRGMEIAVEEINNEGGIKGTKLIVLYEDSMSEPKHAINAYRKLNSLENTNIILTIGSSISLSLAPLVDKNKNIMIAIAATPELSDKSQYVFRNFPSASLQAEKLARLVIEKLNLKKIAILYINDDLGLGSRDAFKRSFTKMGGIVIFEDAYQKDGRDFRGIVVKVKKLNPQAVYIPGYGSALGLVVKQLREVGYRGSVLSSQEFGYPKVLNVAGRAAEEVIYADIPYFPESKNLLVKSFVDRFKTKHDQEPTLDAVLAFDEVKLIANVLGKVGYDPERIKNELYKVEDFQGVSGKLTILPTGDVDFSVILKTIKKGRPCEYGNGR